MAKTRTAGVRIYQVPGWYPVVLFVASLVLAVIPVMLVWTALWGTGPPLTSTDFVTITVLVASSGSLTIWGLWMAVDLRRYRFVLAHRGFCERPRGAKTALVPWPAVAQVRFRAISQRLDLHGDDGTRLGRLVLQVANHGDAAERVLGRVSLPRASLPASFGRGRQVKILVWSASGLFITLGVFGFWEDPFAGAFLLAAGLGTLAWNNWTSLHRTDVTETGLALDHGRQSVTLPWSDVLGVERPRLTARGYKFFGVVIRRRNRRTQSILPSGADPLMLYATVKHALDCSRIARLQAGASAPPQEYL